MKLESGHGRRNLADIRGPNLLLDVECSTFGGLPAVWMRPMLSVLNPEIVPIIQEYTIGLWPIFGIGDRPKLIVKAVKEVLLAAKINRGFKIYVCPMTLAGRTTIGLISAFFDDEDEPLVIRTALLDIDLTRLLIKAMNCDKLDIHFFDEHNRELLGYLSELEYPATTKDHLNSSSYCAFDLELAKSADDQMTAWFGNRTHDDDDLAIKVKFVETLFPEDLFILDARPDLHLYQGGSQFSFSELERKEPGTFQEQDIARSLMRLFSPSQIYMNPLRITDREEIADILVITKSEVIVVQAKDSPNIERVLKNSLDRKKAVARKSLRKAISQVSGAIGYLRSMSPVKMIVGGETSEIDISNQTVRALIVVKELFNDEYSVYTPHVLKLWEEAQIPCIALDYAELQMYVTHLSNEESFFQAFDRVFSHGVKTGQFPRLRIW